MGAVAATVLAVGSALFLLSAVAVIALCHKALRQGTEFEGEIKAPSFSLRLKTTSPEREQLTRDLRLVEGNERSPAEARRIRLEVR